MKTAAEGNTMLGELGAALAAAPDDRIARAVAELERDAPEASAVRGIAEALIGPLRPRLAQLRPRRPPNLSRLAFTPLDPLIVSPALWTRDSLAVPRTALTPLWGTIRDGLGGEEAALRAALARAPEDAATKLGAALWRRAGAILCNAALPPDWRQATGLDEASDSMLAGRVGAILQQAPALSAMEVGLAGGTEPAEAEIAAWLEPLAALPRPALAAGIAILLARLPQADAVMALVEEPTRMLRIDRPDAVAAAEAALGFSLDAAANVRAAGGAAGADAARQVALLLLGLEARALDRPARLARVRAARQAADRRLRASFAEAIATQLSASGLAREPSSALEASARALRRFAGAARQLGSADAYDTAIREAASALVPAADATAVSRLAQARLIEILAGSDAAAAVLAAGRKDG